MIYPEWEDDQESLVDEFFDELDDEDDDDDDGDILAAS